MLYSQVWTPSRFSVSSADSHRQCSIPYLLRCSRHLLQRNDLQDRSKTWKEKPAHIYIDMFDSWIRIRYVRQGLRHRLEVDIKREQPAYASFDLGIRHCHHLLHFNADELF